MTPRLVLLWRSGKSVLEDSEYWRGNSTKNMILRGVHQLLCSFKTTEMIFHKWRISNQYKAPTSTALKPQANDTYHTAPLTYGAHKLYYYQLIFGEDMVMFYMELSCLKVSHTWITVTRSTPERNNWSPGQLQLRAMVKKLMLLPTHSSYIRKDLTNSSSLHMWTNVTDWKKEVSLIMSP